MKRILYIILLILCAATLEGGVSFRGHSSYIRVGSGVNFLLNRQLSGVNGTIIKDVNSSISGQPILFNEGVLQDAGNDMLISGLVTAAGSMALRGNAQLEGDGGLLRQALVISGVNNILEGALSFNNDIVLQDSQTTVTVGLQSVVNKNILLNGGTVYLQDDLYFAEEMAFTGSGIVDGNEYAVHFDGQDVVMTSTLSWVKGATIYINSTAALSGTWTFDGMCVIRGNGNTIDLTSGGKIILAPGTTLLLKNVHLKGIHAGNIVCQSDTCRLVLDQIKWVQDNNFSFGSGSILFLGHNDFAGTYTFAYESSQTSTIASNAEWLFGEGMTLKIGRKKATDFVEPLAFQDASSLLTCNAGTLFVSDYGMQCTKGKLVFDGNSYLDIVGTVTHRGLIFGSGMPGEDCVNLYESGASMHFLRGFYVYNNASPNGLQAMSKTASVTRYNDSKVFIAHDWTLPPWTLRVAPNASPLTTLAPGVSFGYDNTNLIFPQAEMDLTCRQLDSITFALNGNGYLYFSKGVFPLPIMVNSTNNEIRGNGDIAGGVYMGSASARVAFDLQGKLSSDVSMNGGRITLINDLKMTDAVVFGGAGTVDLGANTLDCGSKDSIWTSTLEWLGTNGVVEMNAEIDLSATWTFNGTCIISGNGNILDLGQTGKLVVAAGSTLVLRNVRFKNVSENPVYCVDATSSVVLDNIFWQQDGNVAFTRGSMKFINNVDFIGSYTFSYESSQTSTIDTNSQWRIAEGMTLRIGRDRAQGYVEPLVFADKTSVLRCDASTLHISQYGGQFTKGILVFDGESVLDIAGTTTQSGMIMGNQQLADDFTLFFDSGSAMKFVSGFYVYNNVGPDGLKAASKTASVTRYAASKVYIKSDWDLPPFTLRVARGGAPYTLVAPGVIFSYNNTNLVFPEAEMDLSSQQSDSITLVLNGNDYIYFTKGNFPLPLLISGTNNEIRGSANILGPIILLNSSSVLLCNLNGQILTDIAMNGGTMSLSGDLTLADGVTCQGTGTMQLSSNTIDLGSKDSVWTSTLLWTGDSSTIQLNAEVELSGTWTVSGTCILNGNGNTLNLNSTGQIVVAAGSTLILRNTYIKNISAESVRCLDDAGVVVLDNIAWIQDADTSFKNGSIQFLNQVDFIGSYTFYYDSARTSTVSAKSKWSIKDFMTLSVGKKTQNSAQPVYFEDTTSVLEFDNASVRVTPHGMQATNGTLLFNRDVTIDILSTSTLNGLEFGNGITVNDPILQVSPGAVLNFASGHFIYNITSSMNLRSNSNTARLLRSSTNVFYLKQNLTLPEITVRANPLAQMFIESGKTLTYNNCTIATPQVSFSLIGSRFSPYASLLSGNGLIFITRGTLPLATVVTGSGNRVVGSGSVSGPIMLLDSSAQCNCGIEGAMSSNITLNGGALTLERDLYLAQGATITTQGSVNINAYTLTMGARDSAWTSTLAISSSYGTIEVDGMLDLSGTFTVSGSCTLNAQGNTIDLRKGGRIVVADNTQLVIRNARIIGVAGTNISCLGDAAVLTLDNVIWLQDNDVSFSTGALLFKDSVKMMGDHTFVYQSKQTSTIDSNACLLLDDGFTFSYDPVMVASKNLLAFNDRTASLHLDGATLHSTTTGLQLHTGKLVISRNATMAIETQLTPDEELINEGVTFGTGILGQDISCEILHGGVLNITSGSLRYKNRLSSSLSMASSISSLHMHSNTGLYLYESLNAGMGSVQFDDNTILARVAGKELIATVNLSGFLSHVLIN